MEIITGKIVKWEGFGGIAYEGIVDNVEDGLAWIKTSEKNRALVPIENLKEEIMDEEKTDQETTEETAPEETQVADETVPTPEETAPEESNVVTAESLKKRKNYGRKKWTPEDDEKLLAMYKEGKKRPEMCETFDVKDGAIRSRLYWFKITGKLN